MKKTLFFLASLLTFSFSGDLSKYVDGSTISIGKSRDGIKIYRIGLRKDFKNRYLESKYGYLSGYYELTFNYWKGKTNHNKRNYGIALSPVFNYYFNLGSIKPYLEAGVGVSLFKNKWIDNRNMSTNFLFEDRLGAGVRVGNFDFSFRYMHYSNASIKEPNDGIDIWIGSIAYKFWYNSTLNILKEQKWEL